MIENLGDVESEWRSKDRTRPRPASSRTPPHRIQEPSRRAGTTRGRPRGRGNPIVHRRRPRTRSPALMRSSARRIATSACSSVVFSSTFLTMCAARTASGMAMLSRWCLVIIDHVFVARRRDAAGVTNRQALNAELKLDLDRIAAGFLDHVRQAPASRSASAAWRSRTLSMTFSRAHSFARASMARRMLVAASLPQGGAEECEFLRE